MLALHVAWDMSFPASIGEWHVPARPLYFLWQHHPTSKHKCTRKPAKTQNHHSGFGVCAVLSWTKLPSKCHSPQANQETITSDHGNGLKLFLPNHGPTTLFNTHRNPATRPLNQTKDPAKKIKHDAWDMPFPPIPFKTQMVLDGIGECHFSVKPLQCPEPHESKNL